MKYLKYLMNEKDAITELNKLVSEIDNLKDSVRFSAEHTKWISDTSYYLEEIFGRQSRLYGTFTLLRWQGTGSFITRGYEPHDETDQWHHQGYLSNLDSAKGTFTIRNRFNQKKGIENVFAGSCNIGL